LLLALPFMPLLGVGTLVWGAVMFAASAGAAAGRVVWQAFPERGTTRRGLRWLWRMTRRELD
jgi:hypothetical protein